MAELASLTQLTELDLRGCEGLTALPATLGQLSQLTELNLEYCAPGLTIPPSVTALQPKLTIEGRA